MQKTALVVGMARSGIASARLLYNKGFKVIINDIKTDIPGLSDRLCGIEYVDALGKPPETLLDGVDLMVLSPVIPIFSSFAVAAMQRGIEVIGEIELGYRYAHPDTKFICIGGTNGKTTTTALTGEIFKRGGRNTFVLGNIGIPIAEHAEALGPDDVVVAEVAALQLESIKHFHADAAAILNITEDHLNRFRESMDEYIAAKCRVFENQTDSDFAVLNLDDGISGSLGSRTRARRLYFSRRQEVDEGIFLKDGRLVWRFEGRDTKLIPANEIRIPGLHNLENAMAAAALGLCQGIPAEAVCSALKEFPGVEHRIETVCERGGVVYINDSKGTNPDSTIKAVQAMTRPTILLLGVGNYDKHSDFDPLFASFEGRVKAVIASGINSAAICESAKRAGFKNISVCEGTFEQMIARARDMAEPGDAVLLSPAAASWGMFEDYEQRGRIFKEIVLSIC